MAVNTESAATSGGSNNLKINKSKFIWWVNGTFKTDRLYCVYRLENW